ncbi:MAG: ABC transporter permease [Caldilineaceae bacterium]|nr:ABC transporter permease [Caldilineaceae bacterium]MCB9157587.1 ABC transporter permease [Caldilineaceae bacterium]
MNQSHLSQITWQSHLRALLAVAKKDFLYFVRYPLNAIFRVLQPIIWLTPIYFLGQSFATAQGNVGFAAYAGTGDYMSFILVGAMLSSYISSVFWGMGQSLKEEMDSGVLESNWLTPVPRFSFLIGHTGANIFVTTLVNMGILLLGWLFFGFTISGSLLQALAVVAPLLLALYGFGFAFAAAVFLMRDANTLIDVSDYLVSIFSGGQFPVQVLPRFLLPISLALPITYGLDAVRGLLINTRTLLPIGNEIAIMLVFMGVMMPLGYFVFKRVEQRVKRLGTIGMH